MRPKWPFAYDGGASTSAKIATRHRSPTVTPPTTASLFRSSRRQASRQRLDVTAEGAAATISPTSRLATDAGVDKAIEKIHDEGHERKERAVEQDNGHDHRVVTSRRGLHEGATHPPRP